MKSIMISGVEIIDEDLNLNPAGTSLQGYIDVSYYKLVKVFGELTCNGDGYKVDAEWVINTPDGIATIYNYKDGKNYNGDEGLLTKEITDWHIGGKTKSVVKWVNWALQDA